LEAYLKNKEKQKQPLNILAFDQSYTRLGIAVVNKNGIQFAGSVDLTKLKNRTQKRNCVEQLVRHYILAFKPKAIVVERVRVFAGKYISAGTMEALAGMTARIVDAAYIHSFDTKPIPVFSVDTRSWKKAVLGNSKADKKMAVDFIRRKYKIETDHDGADAACMGLYVFIPGAKSVREQ
jgi:Holliday junction resolvasome RuvABC endonuclease subunit